MHGTNSTAMHGSAVIDPTTSIEKRMDAKVRLMRLAATVCAGFAAVGIGLGIHEANPDSGWAIPALAGAAAAMGFASFWHIAFGSAVGMVRRASIIALFAAATGVTALALGASAQAISTAVVGRAALSTELSARVDSYNKPAGRGPDIA